MWKATEVSAKPNVKYAKIKNNPPVEVQTEERIPKLFNTEEPLPSLISDNFNKVKSDKVFAKSCSQPFGNTEACQKKESIKNSFNPWGLFISSAEAMPLAIPPPVISSSATMAAGTQNQSNNDKAARALTQVGGKFKDESLDNLRFFVETSAVINFSLMLFKALQFPDDTQYTEEELRQIQEVKSRIRVQIIEPEDDDVYPTVRAYHVGDGDDIIPVRYVGKNAQGQYSVTLEEDGPTIYWSPDETGNQVPHTTPSQDDGVSFDDIWVNPLSDAVNDPSTVLPMPAESDWQDRILVFPEGSGIEPLYLVFKTTASMGSGVSFGGRSTGVASPQSLASYDEMSHNVPPCFDDFYYSVASCFAHESISEKGLIPATKELILTGATCGESDLSKRSLPNKRLLYQASISNKSFKRNLFNDNVNKLKKAVKELSSSNLSMKEITDNIRDESRYLPEVRSEIVKHFPNGIPNNNFIATTLLGSTRVNRTISNQTEINNMLSLDNDIELKDILCFEAYEAASKEAFENCLGKLYLTTALPENIAKYTEYHCDPKKEDAYAYLYRIPKDLVEIAGLDTQEAGAVFTTTMIPPSNIEFMKTKPKRAYKKEDFKNEQFTPLIKNVQE